jgi:hypothetical protein
MDNETEKTLASELNMTEAQYERQMAKIRDCVFEKIEEETDDGYLAQIKPEVMKVVLDNIPINEGMDEETFTKVLSTTVVKLEKHITAETKGIHNKLVAVFVNDFITQVFATIFRLESSEENSGESDMMFG